VLPRGTVVEADELCGEDDAGKKTEWEGGKGFPSACNVIEFSYVFLELMLRAWLESEWLTPAGGWNVDDEA
jgi:hypothetical protein